MPNSKQFNAIGKTKPYKGNGRKLGYPTANIDVATDLKDGVYFGYADLARFKNHPALIFIGAPTTMGDKERRVEAHLLDIPDADYYDRKIQLNIMHFHRPNQHFVSVEELKEAMQADEAAARKWFKKR